MEFSSEEIPIFAANIAIIPQTENFSFRKVLISGNRKPIVCKNSMNYISDIAQYQPFKCVWGSLLKRTQNR